MSITLTLVAQAAAFILFIWFTKAFVWPPLMRAIEARQKQIADGRPHSGIGRDCGEVPERRRPLGELALRISQPEGGLGVRTGDGAGLGHGFLC